MGLRLANEIYLYLDFGSWRARVRAGTLAWLELADSTVNIFINSGIGRAEPPFR